MADRGDVPTVSALVWKNMFMDPNYGLFAHLWEFFGATPVVMPGVNGVHVVETSGRRQKLGSLYPR